MSAMGKSFLLTEVHSNRVFHEEYFDVDLHPNLHFYTRLKRYFAN